MPRMLPVVLNNERSGNVGEKVSGQVFQTESGNWWSEAEANLFTIWGNAFKGYGDSFNNPYFDYFYTGQDVQVTIDGLDSDSDILPIYSFAYSIQQQKQPIYGYCSYTYDAMLRGTRIISGAFSIISTAPFLMTQAIAKAADARAASAQGDRSKKMHAIRGLDEDEALINTYWRKNFDSNLSTGQEHIFSIHPPFNFLIRYGIQDPSIIHENPGIRVDEIRKAFSDSSVMMTDFNERLVRNPLKPLDTQILLENVEIVSKQVEYDCEGSPLLETYAFIARDEVLLSPLLIQQPVYVPDTTAVLGNVKSINTNLHVF